MRAVGNDTKRRIAEMRANGATYVEIQSETGVAAGTVAKALKDLSPVCKKCGQTLPVGARYCYICGSKVLTEGEEICTRLVKAAGQCAGAIYADEIRAAISEARTWIMNHEN